ncbi:transcription factor kayak isoform X2 [Copidosoma floridanum]|uniref:transcription factor kayak isoform X2 n=1 Tax=Copidosoma floridanum TaxID=29053 RepID=UPI0006C97F85|nr:transcription factor kayak isoform X2 [Copidosoma floridanum]
MSQLVPNEVLFDNYADEQYNYMCSLYPPTINTMDMWDFGDDKNMQLLSSLDGLHSGVPTRTTPTLTPTTLRTIEQTFLEFTNEPVSHSREAGFVPPLIEPSQPTPAQTQNSAIQHHHHQQQQQQQQLQPTNVLVEVQQLHQQPQPQPQQQQQQLLQQQSPPPQPQEQQPQPSRRNMGGRRPTRTVGMTPEEEERRQVRRERNKLAAARCRKRRMDHTNALLIETEGLEQKKQCLQEEIQNLQAERDELEFMLETHRPVCTRRQTSSPPDIKPIIVPDIETNSELHSEQFSDLPCNNGLVIKQLHHHQHQQQQQHHQNDNGNLCNGGGSRPNRPNSLPMGFVDVAGQRPNSLPIFTEPKSRPSSLQFKAAETPTFMKTISEVAGVPITTPSTGIPFNFDSLMEGGTGLTPVSTPLVPSCSNQQRNNLMSNSSATTGMSAVDLSSPDANPPKLVSL